MPFNEDRLILNLSDTELEDLVKKWLARLEDTYVDFERPTNSADMGRDAVGFLTDRRYEGAWENYQCKQLKNPLGIGDFVVELGKMFHYHCAGEFVLPARYVFVAPKSCVSTVRKLIDKPSTIGTYLTANWDEYCLEGISSKPSPLTAEIRTAIEDFAFENVKLWKASELVEQRQMRAVMSDIMDIDPGQAPTVDDDDVPDEMNDFERPYVGQLVEVFGEHRGNPFVDHSELAQDLLYGPQLTTARRRYLEHLAFGKHFRDSLFEKHIKQVDKDVRDGVIDRYLQMSSGPTYDRMSTIMIEAAKTSVSGPLGKHNRVTTSVKQGACHHFANVGNMPWK